MILKSGKHKRDVPPWLLGLVIAIFLTAVVLILFSVFGYGDDPVIEGLGRILR